MVNEHSAILNILKKKFVIFFGSGPILIFRLGLVCSKLTFSAGIQLFGLKTTSHGKPGLKNSFLRSDFRCGEDQGEVGVQGHPVLQQVPVPVVSQLSDMKTTSHGKHGTPASSRTSPQLKLDLGNELFWSGLPCEVVFRPKS